MPAEIRGRIRYWLRITVNAGRIWLETNAFAHAGAIAFFTLFSMAPVVIVIVSIIGLFYGQEAAQGQIVLQLQETIGRQAAEAVQNAVAQSRLNGGGILATVAGVLAMLVGATTVFGQMQHSLNSIWGVAPRPSRSGLIRLLHKRLTSLAIVLMVGFVMLVSLSLGVALRAVLGQIEGWVPWYGSVLTSLEFLLSLLITAALFAAIFRVLPDVRLRWRDVALGAVVTALLFDLGRSLIAMYLAYTATASTYGAAGSLVLLLLWVNYSSLILLYGAAFTRAYLAEKGVAVQPSSMATRIKRQVIE